jgi:hypothetical protein
VAHWFLGFLLIYAERFPRERRKREIQTKLVELPPLIEYGLYCPDTQLVGSLERVAYIVFVSPTLLYPRKRDL